MDQHGIGRVTEFVMPGDYPEALGDPFVAPVANTFEHLTLVTPDAAGKQREMTTRLSSRDEIQTCSPRGVNAMCRTALPGSSAFTTCPLKVSITSTQALSGKA
jgi:hypothetical protein